MKYRTKREVKRNGSKWLAVYISRCGYDSFLGSVCIARLRIKKGKYGGAWRKAVKVMWAYYRRYRPLLGTRHKELDQTKCSLGVDLY